MREQKFGGAIYVQKPIPGCGAENLSATADTHNWIHSAPNDYQYDAAGNMTYGATAHLNYSFDLENRISGANGYSYTYDADGNRVIKPTVPQLPAVRSTGT